MILSMSQKQSLNFTLLSIEQNVFTHRTFLLL